MHEAEKELNKIINLMNMLPDDIQPYHVVAIAKDIIGTFPQITKKPVKIKWYENTGFFPVKYVPYIEEALYSEDRQAWIDEHYVEVVS